MASQTPKNAGQKKIFGGGGQIKLLRVNWRIGQVEGQIKRKYNRQ